MMEKPKRKKVVSLNMSGHFVYDADEMDKYLKHLEKVWVDEEWNTRA